jgi:hypothetical protein
MYSHKIQSGRQIFLTQRAFLIKFSGLVAGVAELVDAHDSKSCSARSEGSIPSLGTKKNWILGNIERRCVFLKTRKGCSNQRFLLFKNPPPWRKPGLGFWGNLFLNRRVC